MIKSTYFHNSFLGGLSCWILVHNISCWISYLFGNVIFNEWHDIHAGFVSTVKHTFDFHVCGLVLCQWTSPFKLSNFGLNVFLSYFCKFCVEHKNPSLLQNCRTLSLLGYTTWCNNQIKINHFYYLGRNKKPHLIAAELRFMSTTIPIATILNQTSKSLDKIVEWVN